MIIDSSETRWSLCPTTQQVSSAEQNSHVAIYLFIYIYIYREREREHRIFTFPSHRWFYVFDSLNQDLRDDGGGAKSERPECRILRVKSCNQNSLNNFGTNAYGLSPYAPNFSMTAHRLKSLGFFQRASDLHCSSVFCCVNTFNSIFKLFKSRLVFTWSLILSFQNKFPSVLL